MSKRWGPRLRKSRRLGCDLDLTSGVRPIEEKCKYANAPGMHTGKRTRKSNYGVNLMEKQRFCYTYLIRDNTLRRYHLEAMRRMKELRLKGEEEAGYNLLVSLESRLYNVVYQLGFASTRSEARQLVNHKAILVNGKKVNKPSFQMKEGDVISICEKGKQQNRIHIALELSKNRPESKWLSIDREKMQGVFLRFPERNELPSSFQDSRVIQFYSV